MNGSVTEQTTYMSLDVLAQVAADTLQNSEKLQSKIATKKVFIDLFSSIFFLVVA